MKMKKKKKKPQFSIPKTITDSIPYLHVYENGIIELEPGKFSKSYHIPDINFKTVSDDTQWLIGEKFSNFCGEIEKGVSIQISLFNKTIDIVEFQEKVLLPMQPDELNFYREEYNDMLIEKMTGAKNNLETDRILTLTIEEDGIDSAVNRFAQLDRYVTDRMVEITKHDATPLSTKERLEILNTIYNQDSTTPLYRKATIQGHEVESFSLENCLKQGITTKDVIAPSCMSFYDDYIKIGDTFARSYYISNFASWLKGCMLTDFTNITSNVIISAYINVIPQEEAISLLKKQRVNIGARLVNIQKTAAKNFIDASLISPDVADAKNETNDLMDDITKDNGHLFTSTVVITVFAPTKELLNNYDTQIKAIASKNLLTVKKLGVLMEQGFNSSLPIGNKSLEIERLMNSNTIIALNPFDVKEIKHGNGLYYGLNAASNNMILYNRNSGLNPNSCILGMPGAGKSFSAKREICNVILNNATVNDEIYIIDPENEYQKMQKAFGGSEIKVANGSNVYINPFDLNIENAEDGEDPVKVKTDFIESLCEIAIGGKFGLSPVQISIIDRCVMKIYEPYINHLRKTGLSIDTSAAPTMEDFYDELLEQPQVEAQDLALSLERFVKGAQDIFSHQTNVEIDNPFTVFNIKDLGSGLKEMGLHICLDHIWNKMILNKSKGKKTWIYIDEFHVLMQNPTSASYISQIWKRARKWGGIPTAITQNVEDMLKTDDARTIINNSSFLILLGQSPINKEQLSSLLNISREEQKYISSAKPGMGLIRVDDDIIPMNDTFPKNTELYRIMTTRPEE